MENNTRGIQIYLFVIFHTRRVIQHHFWLFSIHIGQYTMHPGNTAPFAGFHGCMENNRQMKLYYPGCMENKQMELYSLGVW
jgi:hypothetical protein